MTRRLLLLAVACAALSCVARAQIPPPSGKVDNLPLLPADVKLSQYAGLVTVDEKANGNLFYWFFEAQEADPASAPLLIWLNGGPGSSSMYGLFSENGPFSLSPDGSTLQMRATAWTTHYNVMFIDNPVGTGFSYTSDASGFVTNQKEVGQDLLMLLYRFYELYPQWQGNPLYICGESYAGKYVPAFAWTIHEVNAAYSRWVEENPHAHVKPHTAGKYSPRSPAPFNVPNGQMIPLAGISIGDGMMDPLTQVPGYGDYLYGLSVIDSAQRDYMTGVEGEIVDMIKQEQWIPAFRRFDPLMMGDEWPFPSYFTNVTGFTDYYNFDTPSYPNNPFTTYLNRPDVQQALNIPPGYVYSSGNNTVEEYLLTDWMQSIAPWLVTLLENYPVLIYSGQNDIILNSVQCQAFLEQLQWKSPPGMGAWKDAPRQIWKVKASDYNVAGYVKQQTPVNQPGLTYIIVREAGHLVPQDQPVRALDMITRFVNQQPWTN